MPQNTVNRSQPQRRTQAVRPVKRRFRSPRALRSIFRNEHHTRSHNRYCPRNTRGLRIRETSVIITLLVSSGKASQLMKSSAPDPEDPGRYPSKPSLPTSAVSRLLFKSPRVIESVKSAIPRLITMSIHLVGIVIVRLWVFVVQKPGNPVRMSREKLGVASAAFAAALMSARVSLGQTTGGSAPRSNISSCLWD